MWLATTFQLYFHNFAGTLKKTKQTINALIWTLAGLYLAMTILVHIPAVQSQIGATVASALSGKKLEVASLQYEGSIAESVVTPADVAPLVPTLKAWRRPVVIASTFHSTSTGVRVRSLDLCVPRQGPMADIRLQADGSLSYLEKVPRWAATISDLTVNAEGLAMLAGKIPEPVVRLGSISYRGRVGGYGTDVAIEGMLRSGAGDARLALARRNDSYWHNVPYIGLGASAHSYDLRTRQWNVSDIGRYMKAIEEGTLPRETELLDDDTRFNDLVTTALRTREGICLDDVPETFRATLLADAAPHLASGLLLHEDNRLHLSRAGILVSNTVMSDLMRV